MDTKVFASRIEMGMAAAEAAADFLRHSLSEKEIVRTVFAAAPSQNEMLAALCQTDGIDWQRVVAFHMDEYIGLDAVAPQRFSNFLKERLFNRLPFRDVHLIKPEKIDSVQYYETLLKALPIDLVCLGIGENGHLAFNDPLAADFNDPHWVKIGGQKTNMVYPAAISVAERPLSYYPRKCFFDVLISTQSSISSYSNKC